MARSGELQPFLRASTSALNAVRPRAAGDEDASRGRRRRSWRRLTGCAAVPELTGLTWMSLLSGGRCTYKPRVSSDKDVSLISVRGAEEWQILVAVSQTDGLNVYIQS